jgi:putative ABC transport system permease protein
MRLLPIFLQAFSNLTASRMRAFLATLGILVGTASVVALVSSGQMATEAALAQFKNLGTDFMAVSIYQEKISGDDDANDTFDLQKALEMKNVSKDIRFIAPYTTLHSSMSSSGVELQGSAIGATAILQSILQLKIKTGRLISFLDQYEPYCVIGDKIAARLREAGIWNPVGQQIQLGNTLFTIIGVAAPWPENHFFYEDINSAVIIPIRASNIINKKAAINNVIFHLREGMTIPEIDALQSKLTRYVKLYMKEPKLFFRSAKQMITQMEAQSKILTLLLGFIGGISLLVGGIGVMNIMLVSVVERRREIGIRLAVGARRRDIQKLFLIESIILSFLGGILGVILGILVSFVIALFSNWQFMVFFWPPVLGCLVSMTTGIFFGVYPAYKASRLNPIDALRSD